MKFKKIFLGLFIISTILFSGCGPSTDVAIIANEEINVNITGPIDQKGHLEVAIQDQTSDIIDYYLRRTEQNLTFNGTQTVGSYDVNFLSVVGIDVGNYIIVQEGSRLFQGQILSILGNTVTLDTPLDFPYTSSADVSEATVDLNVDGSTTPVIFSLEPTQVNQSWDIVRIICTMTHTGSGDDSKFGDITGGLTRGIVLRKTNGISHTIFNAKTNGDLRLRMYDLAYSDRAGAGLYGTSLRRTFGGQDKNGVTIRLDSNENESFEFVVQDDLTSLESFKCVLQGHIVED